MNGWPHDSLQTANGFPSDGTFNPSMLDNSANPQFSNPQYQQPRAQTPSQFPYQPQQLVPSKRPRDDGAVNSPRQPPSNLSLSRSQTPQQQPNNFPGANFQNNQGGPPLQPPNAYQHLQHGGSNNATPSPTLSNQQYRPQSQQPGAGMSPPPDGSGRGTPQNPNQQFSMNGQMGGAQMSQAGPMNAQMAGQNFNIPGTSMPQGYNQNFAAMQNAQQGGQGGYPAVQLTANLAQRQAQVQQQMSIDRQRALRQQQAGMNQMMPHMAANQANMGTPTRQPGQMPNAPNPQQRMMEERAFMEKVARYMQHNRQPFEPQPVVAGRPISIYMLFQMVVKAGGSKRITGMNGWPGLAKSFGMPPEQFPTAGPELQSIFERNLGPWESAYLHSQQLRMQQMRQQQMPGMQPGQQSMSPGRPMPQTPQNMNQPANQQYMALQRQMAQAQQNQTPGQMTPQQNNASLPAANGWSTPQNDSVAARAPSTIDQHRKSASRQLDGSPAQPKNAAFATPPPMKITQPNDVKKVNGVAPRDETVYVPARALKYADSTDSKPSGTVPNWGGIPVNNLAKAAELQASHRCDIPHPEMMGVIDIQAITLSLQSGIAVEVRYALDVLAKLSQTLPDYGAYFDLHQSGDLLDVLIDCGEDQVNFLSDESKRIEGLEYGSYEDIARLAKVELHEIQSVAEPGSKRCEKERAAERLLCVTSILRNLSFGLYPTDDRPHNRKFIGESRAVRFFASLIGLLSTRVVSLYSSINIQDFMKDVIICLSNIAAHVVLESQDDAYNLLQFILAFAPGPIPTETNPFRFASYNPSIHKYYPYAIDVFAKLLAKDERNRTFFKQIFVDVADHEDSEESDLPIHQQYDLLTRAFGMAIAAIPDLSGHERKPLNRMSRELQMIAEHRRPTLSQAMLTADILSTLIPASDPGLAKAWLGSQDSWGCVLFRVITELAEHDGQEEIKFRRVHRTDPFGDPEFMSYNYVSIVSRAMAILKRLAKKTIEDNTQQPAALDKSSGEHDEDKVNGVDESAEDHAHDTDKQDNEALLDDLADMERSSATDFLPLSDSIFNGIFTNTQGLSSHVIKDYIALGDILH